MVGACQQNSGIFLVRDGGRGRKSAVSGGGLGARCLRRPRLGLDEMPTTKSPGQAAGKSLGLAAGSGRDAGGAEAGQAAEPPRPG